MAYAKPFVDRFNAKWKKSDSGCHEWMYSKRGAGYGAMRFNGRDQLAHRISWQLVHGEIPAGMLVCHKCDNPSCVNVEHLFLGTQSDNMKDMVAKNRHPYQQGEAHARAKLQNKDVLKIRDSSMSSSVLAKMYGVTKRTILNVKHGITYGAIAA